MSGGFPEFDEWDIPPESEWRPPIDVPSSLNPVSGFPEVEIGTSSDEDAPPIPASTQLARENLALRARVTTLVAQSKSLEQKNNNLKQKLTSHRTSFASHMKSKIKTLFK
jgi:hypothetical protein